MYKLQPKQKSKGKVKLLNETVTSPFSIYSSTRMNLEYEFRVNFPNRNSPKMLSRMEYEITEISRSFSTLTLYE